MEQEDLPLGGIGVDFTKVEPIQHKRTLAFINHFITHTAHFLNRFSCVCEDKLADITERIQRLQVTATLLETKLASIPGLESVTATTVATSSSSSSGTAASSSSNVNATQGASNPAPVAPASSSVLPEDDESDMSDTESVAPSSNVMTVAQDPRYKKFLQMLKVGVPLVAIRGKVLAEGLDPDLLENPDQAVPDGGGAMAPDDSSSDGDEESDMSD